MADGDDRRAVTSAGAPAALGPYSQAVRVGDQLFCSGQIALDPATGELVEGDFAAQARRVLANLEAVVSAAGMTLADAVKVTIYLTDLADFAVLNEIYATKFGQSRPARATVQVTALPKGASIEMDLVAVARR